MTDEKFYNAEEDIWTDVQGRRYIQNMFNPHSPLWLDISTSYWCLSYHGKANYVDWNTIDLPEGLLRAIQTVVMEKMKKCSAEYLGMTRSWLGSFQKLAVPSWRDFGDISAAEMVRVWEGLNQRYRLYFREMYRTMAHLGIGGARKDIATELRRWKARKNVQVLREVLQWDVATGALTSSEEKVLRDTLSTHGNWCESDKDHAARIFGWLLLDTLKRPAQVLGIRKNGIREVSSSNGDSEWFVEIEPIKHQTGLPLRWWRISQQLAQEILEFSQRKNIAELQQRFDRLVVWDVPCLVEHDMVGTADAKSSLTRYIKKRGAISPRTGEPLHVTPRRIRHTGATRLAFQGVSRDLIQEILEHDSPESAQAYIDAVGSEIVPAIERAGRLMGNIFYELNKGYFQGRVIHDISDKPPVVVPEFTPTPIIVGSCGRDTVKDGVCPKHPFLSCYDGCANFFAWDNPDPHGKALRYMEKEISRWEKSVEAANQQSAHHLIADQTLQSYQRAATAVKEILAEINKDEP